MGYIQDFQPLNSEYIWIATKFELAMSLCLYCIEKTFSATFNSYRAVFQRDREQVQTIFELLCFHPTRKKKYATSPSQLQRSQRQIPLESIPWYWQACTLSESSMSQHLLLPDSPRPCNRLAWVPGYQYVRTRRSVLNQSAYSDRKPGSVTLWSFARARQCAVLHHCTALVLYMNQI